MATPQFPVELILISGPQGLRVKILIPGSRGSRCLGSDRGPPFVSFGKRGFSKIPCLSPMFLIWSCYSNGFGPVNPVGKPQILD